MTSFRGERVPSFGEKLKQQREKRKISLDEISATTKIGTRMLQALEEEKFNQLPGGIFNKGFVRAYARAVGLDEDQTVAAYLEASGEGPPQRNEAADRESGSRENAGRDAGRSGATSQQAARKAERAERVAARADENRIRIAEEIANQGSTSLPWGAFAVVLLVIALVLSLWSHRRREQERTSGHMGTHATVTTETRSDQTAADSTPATSPQSNSTAPGGGPASTAHGTPGSGDQTSLKPAANSAAVGTNASPTPSGEFVVLIHAREESWVSVSVDGKPAGSEVLEPGNERTFHAHNRVFAKVGNAGAVDFQLDGKKLETGGTYGEVKAVTIGPNGVLPALTGPAASQ